MPALNNTMNEIREEIAEARNGIKHATEMIKWIHYHRKDGRLAELIGELMLLSNECTEILIYMSKLQKELRLP